MKQLCFSLFLVLIVASNIVPFRHFFDFLLDEQHYEYASYYGGFNVTDRSGNNITGIKIAFNQYKKDIGSKASPPDTTLYRLFWKNPLCFWRWYSYYSDREKYDLPYISLKEIEKRHKNTIETSHKSQNQL